MLRRMAVIGLVVLAVLAAGCAGGGRAEDGGRMKARSINFEQARMGKQPPGFSSEATNGFPGNWVIRDDPTSAAGAKVLVQEDNRNPRGDRFPLCIYDSLTAKDVAVAVAFKPISGKVDQAAGIIVRCQNKDNYYVARANGLEDNVRLYKVQGGKRTQLAGVDKVTPPAAGQWHELKLAVIGNKFEVGMDGQKLFEATDDTFNTAGKVGLWTKADSVTEFDDLRIDQAGR